MFTKKILTLDDYQLEARRTAIYPNIGKNFIYTTMGLAGEAGELANKVKKLMRAKVMYEGASPEDIVTNIMAIKDEKKRVHLLEIFWSIPGELGGILWYTSQCATELKGSLNLVGRGNLEELSGRVKRGNVEGDGDDRGKS